MRRNLFGKTFLILTAIFFHAALSAQQLKIKDFAVWGGSASATTYNGSQGVSLTGKITIKGNIGSHQQVETKNELTLLGNIVSGNNISFGVKTQVTGNITANKTAADFKGVVINAKNNADFFGNITANGQVFIKTNNGSKGSSVSGTVSVPAPTPSNYGGPTPGGGFSNNLVLPLLPLMPVKLAFDGKGGTTDITTGRAISPGSYRNLSLKGNTTLTFSGPGDYIFYAVNNSGASNRLVFDLKNSSSGIINLFIIKDANWGDVTVQLVNGNDPGRIYTEVHNTGSKKDDKAFVLDGPNANWLGTVWAPSGDIHIKGKKNTITGALWSGTGVTLDNETTVNYSNAAIEPNFVVPYYPPPPGGKVDSINNKIGAELFSLSTNPAPISGVPDNTIFQVAGTKVLIEVISKNSSDQTLKNELIAAGMTNIAGDPGVIDNGPHVFVITGYFPINLLNTLNSNPRIEYVRPLFPPLNNAGQVTSQGDTAMRTDKVRDRFGMDGSGVKVGVLSDSYNSKNRAQQDVNEGDLPGTKTNGQPSENPEPVQVLYDFPLPGNDEGRAMLQIVHDIAPKAKLAYRTGFLTAGDFAKGIKELAAPALPGGRCDVIVDDITYITEPFLRDGIVANAVNDVVQQGVTYFSAAGNFGDRSYEGLFQGVSNPAVIPSPATIHRFGTANSEIYQTLKLQPGTYTIVLQWNDEFHSLGSATGVQTDLDLYLVGTNGLTLFGFNRSNLFGDPFEVCPFTVDEETEAKVMIVNAGGLASNVRFKYIIFRGDGVIMNYKNNNPSTIVGHPNAEGCIAVGAMLYANIPQFTPVYPGVASFSSRGGTATLGTNNNYAPRLKPDLVTVNGVNTTVTLNAPNFNDGDAYPNFFGTSAAAPHAAAVAALLIQGKKKFGLPGTIVTPAEIRSLLTGTAGAFPGLPAGHNYVGGFGFLRADSAASQIANARPVIKSWAPAGTALAPNGTDSFPVKIKGEYLTADTKVYFNGQAISNTVVSADRTEATATIPAFTLSTDPAMQLYNPPKSASGDDGGMSEAIRFFSAKKDVTVRVVDTFRKYGQANPAFTVQVFIDGVPIEQTGITRAELKLTDTDLSFFTNASPASTVGLYGIVPSRTVPLNNTVPAEAALLSQYGFTFVPGTLSVGKMNLKITPLNKEVKYGDFIGEISYRYEFDNTTPGTENLLDEIRARHQQFIADNTLGVVQGYNTQSTFTDADLLNMSGMASFQAVRNARKFRLVNGQLLPLEGELPNSEFADQRFLVDVSAQSLINYKNNKASAVMTPAFNGQNQRGLLNIKALAGGTAKASLLNGQLQPMVNGQLLAMVNGQLQALVNGQLLALVNGQQVIADDYVFENGQLLALVNGTWTAITSGQLRAIVNGLDITIDLAVDGGNLSAVANGIQMTLMNGQLRALVNDQLLALVNGQLQALVNGQLMPIVNGQLMALVNGQLQPLVNGQLMALVNGQLMALVNGQLESITSLTLSNGQLQALVNGQLLPLVNGQLRAMVNGTVVVIPNESVNLVNGQLRALVNEQLQALVNGQLRALVNEQTEPLVNGDLQPVSSVTALSNGQLRALVNDIDIPIANGQLQALVNGQLLALVNGQLMALVNGELHFAVFTNGQLRALVNGELQPLDEAAISNGQLRALVNGQLQPLVNVSITNGQLQALVNGQLLAMVNGQLLALVNGQLQPLVNNFSVSGTANNTNTVVVVDQDDITLQGGSLGGMFSINMVTGLDVGLHKLIPGAFTDENFEVSYGLGEVLITPRPLIVRADPKNKVYGSENPELTFSASGFSYGETEDAIVAPEITTTATAQSHAGNYPIFVTGGSAANYTLVNDFSSSVLTITKKPLTITAEDKTMLAGSTVPPLTLLFDGLANDDTQDSICAPYVVPPSPKVIDQLLRISTYTNVKLNGESTAYVADPGEAITLTGNRTTAYNNPTNYCPGCITQLYLGMPNGGGAPPVFTYCFDISGSSTRTAALNISFNAPLVPGVYYITQSSSWEYNCYDNGSGQPDNNPANAIAVVIVRGGGAGILSAGTTATSASSTGVYPITVQTCGSLNYEVTTVSGWLTVLPMLSATTRLATTLEQSAIASGEEGPPSRIFPNPVTTAFRVQLEESVRSANEVVVMDMLGKIQTGVTKNRLTEVLFEINVSNLPKGVYFLRARTATGDKIFKFVKL